MAPAKIKFTTKKGGANLLFLMLALVFTNHTSASEIEENQKIFESGVNLLFSEEYKKAQDIFADLFQTTQAPRVKLEWARAAFLNKDYNLARQLFIEVLEQPNLPDLVRFNISLFLNEIAKYSDFTDYRFSFVRDSNPFSVPKAQKILIFGLPFSYTPPIPQETLNGLSAYLYHSRTLSDNGNLRFIAEAEGTFYGSPKKSKAGLKFAIEGKHNRQDSITYRIGIDQYQQKSETVLEQPYAAIKYRDDKISGIINQLQWEARYSLNKYPNYQLADGAAKSLNFLISKNIGNSLQLSAGLYLDQVDARTDSQSFKTKSLSGGLRFFLTPISSNIFISISQTNRKFNGVDELFLTRRIDERNYFGVTIQPYSKRIFGLYPSIEIGKETTNSSINISSFEKQLINFSLRKNY